jgi:hypothetical protein
MKCLSAALVCLALAAPASAALVASFGGDTVSADQPMEPASWIATRPQNPNRFEDAAYISPSSGYSGQPFYGGYAGDVYFDDAQLLNDGSTDYVEVDGFKNDWYLLAVYKKPDFLGSPSSVTVGGASMLTADASTSDQIHVRFVLGEGGSYFVSDEVAVNGGTGLYELSPAGASWSTYDPASDITSYGTPGAKSFGEIDAVGVLVHGYDGWDTRVRLHAFEADLVVPEPATVALLALGGLTLVGRRR